jgi:hypothetical protein
MKCTLTIDGNASSVPLKRFTVRLNGVELGTVTLGDSKTEACFDLPPELRNLIHPHIQLTSILDGEEPLVNGDKSEEVD